MSTLVVITFAATIYRQLLRRYKFLIFQPHLPKVHGEVYFGALVNLVEDVHDGVCPLSLLLGYFVQKSAKRNSDIPTKIVFVLRASPSIVQATVGGATPNRRAALAPRMRRLMSSVRAG